MKNLQVFFDIIFSFQFKEFDSHRCAATYLHEIVKTRFESKPIIKPICEVRLLCSG